MQICETNNTNKHQLHVEFPSGEMSVRQALGQLMSVLTPYDLSEDDLGSVEIVLGEVLNNVVEHAYAESDDGMVLMSCTPGAHVLRFCVEDEGVALPHAELPKGTLPCMDGPLETLPEGGFGWYLVQNLALDLHYRRIGRRNVLAFSIPFEGNG